jgi:hypothetical protein
MGRTASASTAWLTTLALAVPVVAGCTRPVTEHERAMFLEAGDLADWGYEGVVRPEDEKVTHVRSIDGTREITYEYESPNPANPLYVHVAVTIQKNVVGAHLRGVAEDFGSTIGLRSGGVGDREMPGGRVWGEASTLAALVHHDVVVGHRFSARSGGRTYHLILTGIHADEAQTWDEMIEPQMDAFLSYAPP